VVGLERGLLSFVTTIEMLLKEEEEEGKKGAVPV
jgi:hypothetical protein